MIAFRGRDVTAARDEAVAKGITINGLVNSDRRSPCMELGTHQPSRRSGQLLSRERGRRPGGIRTRAENFSSFWEAITKKMIAEVALLQTGARIR